MYTQEASAQSLGLQHPSFPLTFSFAVAVSISICILLVASEGGFLPRALCDPVDPLNPLNPLTSELARSFSPCACAGATFLFLDRGRNSRMVVHGIENGLHETLVGIRVFLISMS